MFLQERNLNIERLLVIVTPGIDPIMTYSTRSINSERLFALEYSPPGTMTNSPLASFVFVITFLAPFNSHVSSSSGAMMIMGALIFEAVDEGL
jgi:hypothetical protein